MTELCPLHCINAGCPQPSFLEEHETFILTIISLAGTGIGVLLAYCLKSRCKKIKFCCGLFSFNRSVTDTSIVETIEQSESSIA
jgi:hypothetical protein